jgi:hypothetical protein
MTAGDPRQACVASAKVTPSAEGRLHIWKALHVPFLGKRIPECFRLGLLVLTHRELHWRRLVQL